MTVVRGQLYASLARPPLDSQATLVMFRFALLCVGVGLIGASPGVCDEVSHEAPVRVVSGADGPHGIKPQSSLPQPELLDAITAWLTTNFDLPPAFYPPSVEFRSLGALAVMHYGHAAAAGVSLGASVVSTPDSAEIVALYDDQRRTIYLAEGWSGRTPAEISLRVPEMVHLAQN
jgi:hypothetical protein